MSNVFVDRHHSGLYHSWQLMAARFGWTLYTPVGHEWWDEDYWRFGLSTYNDDRLAQQFLMGAAGLGSIRDGEFPEWPINGVTVDQAREMDWAYVIATVPDNEAGFVRFAHETGAQYVVGVGNTGQYVNWGYDPLALVSSEMPIMGRGIVYHQEMDRIAYRPPEGWFTRDRAASFVNCMPQMGTCWDLLEVARGQMTVDAYGIEGPAGIVKPFSRLVALMSSYGWGWHDKAQGDGFGHVIHAWAAVGRPLVGHASHYRGKMAEPFWQDGLTCIDLDQHTVDEAVEMIRAIPAREHARMCEAIRATFEREVDYDAEARIIADFLGLAVAV